VEFAVVVFLIIVMPDCERSDFCPYLHTDLFNFIEALALHMPFLCIISKYQKHSSSSEWLLRNIV